MSEKVINLKNLEYYIAPSDRTSKSPHGPTQDKIFDFWCDQWTNNFKKSNPKPGWQDHFLRMSLATAIGYEGKMIACLLFRFCDLQAHATRQSEYFSYLDKGLPQKLVNDGWRDAMSVEYLAVDPEWTKNSLNVSMGKLIITLSAYVAEDHNRDCIISMPIGGTKVDKMLENIGAFTIQDNIPKYGYTLKLMFAKTNPATKSVDSRIKVITDVLWQNRRDYSSNNNAQKIAA